MTNTNGAALQTADLTVRQVPGVSTIIDTSHATGAAAPRLAEFFRAKSRHDVDETMACFDHGSLSYLDATLESSSLSWDALNEAFGQFMPNWGPEVKAYATRIVGSSTGALVMCVDTPGAFGPNELRIAAAVDFRDDKIVRWVDYWDGRHFGLEGLAKVKSGDPDFATDLRNSIVGEMAAPELRRVAQELAVALSSGDSGAAIALFAADAVFEDLPAHLLIHGPASIERFLKRTAGRLPYAHSSTELQHVVGGALGGAYEWTTTGPVPRGLTALELDSDALITRFTAMWDSSTANESYLSELARRAVES